MTTNEELKKGEEADNDDDDDTESSYYDTEEESEEDEAKPRVQTDSTEQLGPPKVEQIIDITGNYKPEKPSVEAEKEAQKIFEESKKQKEAVKSFE